VGDYPPDFPVHCASPTLWTVAGWPRSWVGDRLPATTTGPRTPLDGHCGCGSAVQPTATTVDLCFVVILLVASTFPRQGVPPLHYFRFWWFACVDMAQCKGSRAAGCFTSLRRTHSTRQWLSDPFFCGCRGRLRAEGGSEMGSGLPRTSSLRWGSPARRASDQLPFSVGAPVHLTSWPLTRRNNLGVRALGGGFCSAFDRRELLPAGSRPSTPTGSTRRPWLSGRRA